MFSFYSRRNVYECKRKRQNAEQYGKSQFSTENSQVHFAAQ